jgi:hypothetical protein
MATATKKVARQRDVVTLPFDSFRNITSAADKEKDRKIFTGQMPAEATLTLEADENVRQYLVEAEGKKRRALTQVHRAIRDTLENNPGDFPILNGGLVIVARACEVDEQKKVMRLTTPSIINGSQTQGVMKDFYADCKKNDIEPDPIFVTFQLIVTEDEQLIAETSISRNYQNDVKHLSIVGRLGHLDELEKAMEGEKLRKSETDLTGIPTEKLLQVLAALMPEELWAKIKPHEKSEPNKVYTYSMKAKCLKEFDDVYTKAHTASSDDSYDQEAYEEVYRYYLDVASDAWRLYEKWKNHQGFQGTGIKNGVIREDDGRTIKEVQDGLVFPILAALSVFVDKIKGRWQIRIPATFDDKDLIQTAIQAYQRIANSNPWNMGKDRGCYAMCYGVTSLYKKLIGSVR